MVPCDILLTTSRRTCSSLHSGWRALKMEVSILRALLHIPNPIAIRSHGSFRRRTSTMASSMTSICPGSSLTSMPSRLLRPNTGVRPHDQFRKLRLRLRLRLINVPATAPRKPSGMLRIPGLSSGKSGSVFMMLGRSRSGRSRRSAPSQAPSPRPTC